MKLTGLDSATTKRIHVDRKIIGILSAFAILGLCLLTCIVIATDTLSAIRGYSTLQTHYTERRKQATLELIQYAQFGNDLYLQNFHQSLHLIRSAKKARQALLKDDTNRQKVREYLLQTNTVPEDIDLMITAFERFHAFRDYRKAIDNWIRSDELIGDMRAISDSIQQAIKNQSLTPEFRQSKVEAIRSLDNELTNEQYQLSASLSQGTAFLNKMLLWISISLGAILLITGILLSFRLLSSIKNWHKIIEMSEQRYKSLFQHNPNAAFQMLPSGQLLSSNKSFYTLSGYEKDEISSLKLHNLIASEHKDKVNDSLNCTVKGSAQNLEVLWKNKDQSNTPVLLTLLPIYINNQIMGVFGVAEDISYQKYAERKIKDQLEEKTYLLSEIHDRVKNNLALISGLLQLQRDQTENKNTKKHFESTISRIHSMALVHERLYQSGTFANIRFDKYISELNHSLIEIFELDPSKYEINIQTDPVTLGLKQAISVGLLLNEVISNALRYAFPQRDKGKIDILLHGRNGHIILEVADDGTGLSGKVDINNQHSTLGIQLIQILADQLNASMKIIRQQGTRFRFQIPCKKE